MEMWNFFYSEILIFSSDQMQGQIQGFSKEGAQTRFCRVAISREKKENGKLGSSFTKNN